MSTKILVAFAIFQLFGIVIFANLIARLTKLQTAYLIWSIVVTTAIVAVRHYEVPNFWIWRITHWNEPNVQTDFISQPNEASCNQTGVVQNWIGDIEAVNYLAVNDLLSIRIRVGPNVSMANEERFGDTRFVLHTGSRLYDVATALTFEDRVRFSGIFQKPGACLQTASESDQHVFLLKLTDLEIENGTALVEWQLLAILWLLCVSPVCIFEVSRWIARERPAYHHSNLPVSAPRSLDHVEYGSEHIDVPAAMEECRLAVTAQDNERIKAAAYSIEAARPANEKQWQEAADLFASLGMGASEIIISERFLMQEPTNVNCKLRLGDIYRKLPNMTERARNLARSLLAASDLNASQELLVGALLNNTRLRTEAASYYKSHIARHPDSFEGYVRLTRVLISLGNNKEARAVLFTLGRAVPRTPAWGILLAEYLIQAGAHHHSTEWIDVAVAGLNPKSVVLLRRLVKLLHETKDQAGAESYLLSLNIESIKDVSVIMELLKISEDYACLEASLHISRHGLTLDPDATIFKDTLCRLGFIRDRLPYNQGLGLYTNEL